MPQIIPLHTYLPTESIKQKQNKEKYKLGLMFTLNSVPSGKNKFFFDDDDDDEDNMAINSTSNFV